MDPRLGACLSDSWPVSSCHSPPDPPSSRCMKAPKASTGAAAPALRSRPAAPQTTPSSCPKCQARQSRTTCRGPHVRRLDSGAPPSDRNARRESAAALARDPSGCEADCPGFCLGLCGSPHPAVQHELLLRRAASAVPTLALHSARVWSDPTRGSGRGRARLRRRSSESDRAHGGRRPCSDRRPEKGIRNDQVSRCSNAQFRAVR